MSTIRLVDLAILTALMFLALLVVPSAWAMLRLYLGIRWRRLEDASSFAPPPPPAVSTAIDQLTAVGFRRIGERSAVLPGNRRRFEWNLVDQPTTTYVALVPAPSLPGGVLMACYSAFADDAFLSTYFPAGATVEQPGLESLAAGRTPGEAVDAHYERLALFSVTHGLPLPNRTMADLLVRDDTYRRLHGGATLRSRVYRVVALAAILVIATAAELLRIVVIDR